MHSQWKPIVRLVNEVEDNILPLFENCSVVDFALISVVAGTSEEALFRGVIQPSLGHIVSPWGAIAIAGMLFGLLHLITPTYAALAGLIGVYLGWLMMASENLLLPIAVHILYDFLALTYVFSRYKARIGL
jgi:membrane protease YdiL (CAAX protease family)